MPLKDPEKRKEYRQQYYLKHKEKICRRAKQYQQTEKGKKIQQKAVKKFNQSKKGKEILKKARIKYYKKHGIEKIRKIHRENHFLSKYNLTIKQRQQLYLNQNGCCAICQKSVSYNKVQTDHDHITGKVRGLLCHRCNHFVVAIEDNEFIRKAQEYIKDCS